MIDAKSVYQTLGEPAPDLDMGGVEHRAVLLPQPGKRRDRKEAPVAADAVAPSGQPVVPVVGRIARRGGVVVGTEYRQDNSAVGVEIPVDIKVGRVRRRTAVLEHVAPPRVLVGML